VSEHAADRRAYLHIGAPKTGSTFLQGVLWNNREALLEHGVHMLGDDQGQHYRAGHDLRGRRFDPADPGVDWTGAWDRMARRAGESTAPGVVVSDEHLASLQPGQVTRAVEALAPREVHVVYATRDLVGLLPSEYQEFVKHGATASYDAWVADVLAANHRGPGRWFWRVHDAADVVARWSTGVPLERIHVITMPGPNAPRDEIWRRFASVLGVDPSVATAGPETVNTSLGPTEVEVLRRVNAALPSDFPRWHRTGIARDVLANRVLNPVSAGGRLELRSDLQEEVLHRAQQAAATLPTLGCDVVGRLDDLAFDPTRLSGSAPATPEDLVDVLVRALAGMAEHAAEMTDAMAAERLDRRRAEEAAREQHQREIEQALAAQDAAFWERHPVAHRIQRGKERVVAAEEGNGAVRAALSGYRRLRGGMRA
jgi:hypothetical protein